MKFLIRKINKKYIDYVENREKELLKFPLSIFLELFTIYYNSTDPIAISLVTKLAINLTQ